MHPPLGTKASGKPTYCYERAGTELRNKQRVSTVLIVCHCYLPVEVLGDNFDLLLRVIGAKANSLEVPDLRFGGLDILVVGHGGGREQGGKIPERKLLAADKSCRTHISVIIGPSWRLVIAVNSSFVEFKNSNFAGTARCIYYRAVLHALLVDLLNPF